MSATAWALPAPAAITAADVVLFQCKAFANEAAARSVQHLFGVTVHPCVLDGKVPLRVQLLSPADRPIQVTSDLPGFWGGSWADVRKDMAGRYPKHQWPDDPANAAPKRMKDR